jgi:hypothetical protein
MARIAFDVSLSHNHIEQNAGFSSMGRVFRRLTGLRGARKVDKPPGVLANLKPRRPNWGFV